MGALWDDGLGIPNDAEKACADIGELISPVQKQECLQKYQAALHHNAMLLTCASCGSRSYATTPDANYPY